MNGTEYMLYQLSLRQKSTHGNCHGLRGRGSCGRYPQTATVSKRLDRGLIKTRAVADSWAERPRQRREPSVVEIVRRQFSPGVAGSACMAYLMAACLAGRSSPTSQRSPRNRAHFFQLCVSSSHLFHFSFLLHAPLPTAHFPIETNR